MPSIRSSEVGTFLPLSVKSVIMKNYRLIRRTGKGTVSEQCVGRGVWGEGNVTGVLGQQLKPNGLEEILLNN